MKQVNYGLYTFAVAVVILALEVYRFLTPSDLSRCRNLTDEKIPSPSLSFSSAKPTSLARHRDSRRELNNPDGTVDMLAELDVLRENARVHKQKLVDAGRMPQETMVSKLVAEAAENYREEMKKGKRPTEPQEQRSPAPSPSSQSAAPHYRPPPRPTGVGQPGLGKIQPVPTASPSTALARQFGSIFNQQIPGGFGIILGVGDGSVAEAFLETWSNSAGLYLVDPFIRVMTPTPDNKIRPACGKSGASDQMLQLRFEKTHKKLGQSGKFGFIRDLSSSFLKTYQQQSNQPIPFIFWGKCSSACDVLECKDPDLIGLRKELEDWWPLIAQGGIIMGEGVELEKLAEVVAEFGKEVHAKEMAREGEWWVLVK